MVADPIKVRMKGAANLKRAWQLVWQAAPRQALIGLVLMVIQTALPVLSLLLLKQIVDSLAAALGQGGDVAFAGVAIWIGLAGAVALTAVVLNSLAAHIAEAQSLSVSDYVTDLLHEKSIAVDLAYYEDPSYHDTLHLVQQDALSRPVNIVNGLQQTLQNLLILGGIVTLLFASHWGVGLALLLAALPAGIVRLIYARQIYLFDRDRVAQERQAWYYHWMMTSLDFARDVRLLGIGGLLRTRYCALRARLREGRLEIGARRARRDIFTQGGATVALYATLAVMAYLAVQGAMTLGVIVMYFQGYQRALAALQNVLQGLAKLYEDNLFFRHFHDFIGLPVGVEQQGGESLVAEPADLGLVCRDLTFSYPGRTETVLDNLSLEIRPGEVVALVGANGAGKTTLAKLICRLYDPQAGQILWEGQDLRSFQPAAWRRQISVLSQDFTRFDLPVAENIQLGDIGREADSERLATAAQVAGADRLIGQLPDGMATQLGTHFQSGRELSVGEWQRIALARTWFRDAALMIFDEPSSALDPLAEAEMIDAFRRVIGRRSALVISHRLSSVQLADRIHVMDRGRIVESGTHRELLQRDGAYARLFNTQAAFYQSKGGENTE